MTDTATYTMPENAGTLDEILEAVSLAAFLDKGGDLSLIPDIDFYAKVIMSARHAVPWETREYLAGTQQRNLYDLLMGNCSQVDKLPADEGWEIFRRAAWLAGAVANDELAERFEAALPTEVRLRAWQAVRRVQNMDWLDDL